MVRFRLASAYGQVKAEEKAEQIWRSAVQVYGGPPVHLADRVGVVPQRGRAAPAVAEAHCGVAEVKAAGEELACGVCRPPLMSNSTPAASAAAAI